MNRSAHLLPDAPFAYDDPEMGLNYHEHRHFDSTVGRWVSDEQVGFEAGDKSVPVRQQRTRK